MWWGSDMKIVTARDRIRTVAERWKRQYKTRNRCGIWRSWSDAHAISERNRLDALDVESCSVQDVEKIIQGWANIKCYECGATSIPHVVQIGEDPTITSWTVWLCESCIAKAHAMIREANG